MRWAIAIILLLLLIVSADAQSNIGPSAGFSLIPQLAYSGNATGSVGTSSTQLVGAGTYTRSLTISTLPASTNNVYLRLDGGVAAVGTEYLLAGGGASVTFGASGLPMPSAAINAITDGNSSQTVMLAGG